MKINYKYLLILACGLMTLSACDKLLEFEPGDVILAEDALKTPEDLQRLLNSNYDVIGNLFDGRVQVLSELLTDNLSFPEDNNDYAAVYGRQTNFFTSTTNGVYADFYRAIYRCNTVLESFDFIEGLDDGERKRIEAEARFIRALCHWSLVKLYAQPYNNTANNDHLGIVIRLQASQEPLGRNTVGEVYDAVLADLNFAHDNLPLENGFYANRLSAAGYLAHVYFLMNELPNAALYASEVINSNAFSLDGDLDRYEQDNISPETVFGIVSFSNDFRNDGFSNNYRSDIGTPVLSMSESVFSTFSLNPSDMRNDWIENNNGSYFSTRFNGSNYFNVPLVHLTGLHLLRAEALAEQNIDLDIAIGDVNAIRTRAFGEGINQLPLDAAAEDIINAAREEMFKETICEGVWIDYLKRRGTLGEDITIRNAPYDCPGMALQFPNGETSVAGFQLNPEGGCN